MIKEYESNFRWIKTCAPKPRNFKLKNIITNEVIEAKNIRQWCINNKLPKNSNISIHYLLSRKCKRYLNYCLPETNIPIIEIKNIKTGRIIRHFHKKYIINKTNISLNKLNKLLSKNIDRIGEFALLTFNNYNSIPVVIDTNNNKKYLVYESWNKFCIDNDIHQGRLTKHGKHKNWKWINK